MAQKRERDIAENLGVFFRRMERCAKKSRVEIARMLGGDGGIDEEKVRAILLKWEKESVEAIDEMEEKLREYERRGM
jgi:hypothetical protein